MKLQDITVQDVLDLAEKQPDLKVECLSIVAHSKNGATSAPTDHVFSRGRPSFSLLKVKAALEQEALAKFPPIPGGLV